MDKNSNPTNFSEPTLCRKCLAFYGTPQFDHLCSRCFKFSKKCQLESGRANPTRKATGGNRSNCGEADHITSDRAQTGLLIRRTRPNAGAVQRRPACLALTVSVASHFAKSIGSRRPMSAVLIMSHTGRLC